MSLRAGTVTTVPSGKQSRKRRQAARVPPPPGQRRRASPKVLLAAAGVLVLIGVGVGLGVALSSSSSSSSSTVPTRGSLVNALPQAKKVQQLLQGIPQNGNVLGKPSAPVTVVEYIDLQCPFCQQFESHVFPDLVSKYIRPGKVKLEARPLAFIGPDSERGREAAIAAGRQGKFFNFAEILYYNQGAENTGWLDQSMVERAAASIPGLDVPQLVDAAKSSDVKSEASQFDSTAQADQVSSTPTILVGRSGGTPTQVPLTSPTDEQSVVAAIKQALS